jgi:hypothetical protein
VPVGGGAQSNRRPRLEQPACAPIGGRQFALHRRLAPGRRVLRSRAFQDQLHVVRERHETDQLPPFTAKRVQLIFRDRTSRGDVAADDAVLPLRPLVHEHRRWLHMRLWHGLGLRDVRLWMREFSESRCHAAILRRISA